jgi:hypothetical protein
MMISMMLVSSAAGSARCAAARCTRQYLGGSTGTSMAAAATAAKFSRSVTSGRGSAVARSALAIYWSRGYGSAASSAQRPNYGNVTRSGVATSLAARYSNEYGYIGVRCAGTAAASTTPSLRDLPQDRINEMLNNSNIADLVTQACESFADKPSLGTRVGNQYEWITYRELGRRIQKLRNVLIHHKVGKDTKVALISNNREEWAVTMYAVASLGGQLVPM